MPTNPLRLYRQVARLTIRELSEESGVSSTTISRLENDLSCNPSVSTLVALAKVLSKYGDKEYWFNIALVLFQYYVEVLVISEY